MPAVAPDVAAVFHSAANASLGCRQVRPLFAPQSCHHFSTEYFERRHLLTRDTGFDTVLSSEGLFRAAAHWQFKVAQDHSQARLLKPGSFSHDAEWADGSLLDGPAMRAALASNRTVVLHNMELYWWPVGALCMALMRTFGVYSQANVYYSPPGLPSAVHAHQDAQSVFIIQCEGRKTWQLLTPPQRWRLRFNQRGKGGDVAPEGELGQPIAQHTLEPGDVLFVPRGMYHRTSTEQATDEASSAGGGAAAEPRASLHVTVGVETDTDGYTWLALLKAAAATIGLENAESRLEAALWEDERLREALPLRVCRYGESFGRSEPSGGAWVARGRDLLAKHLGVRPEADRLREALDTALRTRQEHVEQKRLQLLEFMGMSAPLM